MGRTPRIFVISGPSGVGKGTLVALLRERRPDLHLAVSATTRQPRDGEIPNISYYFMDEDEFMRLADEGAFVEWDGHFEKRYGTLWSEVNSHLEQGQSVLLEIDVNGAINVQKAIPDAVLIFIAPPSLVALEERLRARGAETEEQIALRLARVEMEMSNAHKYHEVLVNDDLDVAVDELEALIDKYENEGGIDQDVSD